MQLARFNAQKYNLEYKMYVIYAMQFNAMYQLNWHDKKHPGKC